MKKVLRYFLILSLIIIFPILFSSCGNNKKLTITSSLSQIEVYVDNKKLELNKELKGDYSNKIFKLKIGNNVDPNSIEVFVNDSKVDLNVFDEFSLSNNINFDIVDYAEFSVSKLSKNTTIKVVAKERVINFNISSSKELSQIQQDYANNIFLNKTSLLNLITQNQTYKTTLNEIYSKGIVFETSKVGIFNSDVLNVVSSVNEVENNILAIQTENLKEYKISLFDETGLKVNLTENNSLVLDLSNLEYSSFKIINDKPCKAITIDEIGENSTVTFGSQFIFNVTFNKDYMLNKLQFVLKINGEEILPSNKTNDYYSYMISKDNVPSDFGDGSNANEYIITYEGLDVSNIKSLAEITFDTNNLVELKEKENLFYYEDDINFALKNENVIFKIVSLNNFDENKKLYIKIGNKLKDISSVLFDDNVFPFYENGKRILQISDSNFVLTIEFKPTTNNEDKLIESYSEILSFELEITANDDMNIIFYQD